MKSIKLVIWTGKQYTDIVDIGTVEFEEELIEGVLRRPDYLDYHATHLLPTVEVALKVVEEGCEWPDTAIVGDLLKAKAYLSKLKAACEQYPQCIVHIETI